MSIARIAKHAGVSISTVSRVMTNSRNVQPEIEQKVRRAIEELNLPVRQNRRREKQNGEAEQRPPTIAIITLIQEYKAWFTDPVIAQIIAELCRAAADLHVGVLIAEMLDPDVVCPIVRQGRVDGALVIIPSYADLKSAQTLARHVPVVRAMESQICLTNIEQIGFDDFSIGMLAAQYLIGRGCHELAFMTFAPDWSFIRMRAQGFFSGIDAYSKDSAIGIAAYFTPPPVSVAGTYGSFAVCRPDWDQVMKEFVARRPTGLFVPRDADLLQAYALLRKYGIEPERDITIVSCDNCEAYLSQLDVRPASIDISIKDLAQNTVARLLNRIKHPTEPVTRTLVYPRFVATGQ